MEILTLCISVLTIIINTIPYAATRADRKAVVSSKLIIQRNLINYRNASNKRPGAYLISKLEGGAYSRVGAYILFISVNIIIRFKAELLGVGCNVLQCIK